jgi:hypothetical protein
MMLVQNDKTLRKEFIADVQLEAAMSPVHGEAPPPNRHCMKLSKVSQQRLGLRQADET